MRMSYFPPLVVAGCSGAGKGTLIGRVMKANADAYGFSVSHTTRKPRPGEEDGVHYHFATVEEVQRDIERGLFLEHACVHGNYYGTSKAAVEAVQKAGKICILDIDVQGVRSVKACGMAAKYLWIEAPDMATLEARLRARGTETEEKVRKRMKNAVAETAYAHPEGGEGPFDCYLVNDDCDAAQKRMEAQLEAWYPHLAQPAARKNPCSGVTGFFASLFGK
mmetsp:Transcript_3070/g.8967  ORF Transcript_3070/g.8967 Transcript_3070/m.8967 type:complete len:221 (+) Transcript_3070:276-938(+)